MLRMDYYGRLNGLVEIQETDVYYISLPENKPLCVTGVSPV